MKNKLIVIGPLPPPYYGQSIGFESLCKELEHHTDLYVIDIQPKYSMPGHSWKLTRIFEYLKSLCIFLYYLIKTDRNCIVYITIAQSSAGFVRDFAFIISSYFFKRKVIAHLKGGNFKNFFLNSNYIQKYLIKFLYKKVYKIIVLGSTLKSCFDFSKKINSKVVVIENGLTNENVKFENKLKNESSQINILFLSNLILSKGYLDLLNALEYFEMFSLDYKCIFAGNIYESPDDPSHKNISILKNDFFNKINKLQNNKNIFYLGPVEGKLKTKLLLDADVFILPTYYVNEGQPISIIEAMAHKNVIISTKYNFFQPKTHGLFVLYLGNLFK